MKRLALPLLAFVVIGCPGPKPVAHIPTPPAVVAPPSGPVKWKISKSGLGFRISDADEDTERPPRGTATTTPLSEADTKRLLDRLPALAEEPLAQPFALREKSPPAPRPGKTIQESFPPPRPPAGAPPAVKAGPLKVLRFAPEGKVDVAPYLSVTFSAPMVPVTSHAELAKIPIPVTLTPPPKGEWRWVGTQSVVFHPDPRFPMATDYAVDIPAGTKAASGETLAEAVRFTFETPPPRLVNHHPRGGPQTLKPVLFAELDQAMDEKELFSRLEVTGDGSKVPLRLATPDEIEEEPSVSNLSQRAKKGRWIAVVAAADLSPATTYKVVIPKGTRGAEGPKPTAADHAFQFRTYDPFRMRESSCGWGHCVPLTPFTIHLNNPIDRKAFEKGIVTVTPAIAGMKVTAAGDSVTVSGKTKGKTRYTVTLSRALKDVFGQSLARDEKATFDVSPAPPTLFPEDSDMVVQDPASMGKYSIFSVNDPTVKVRIFQVKPEDWPKYREFRDAWDHDRKVTTPPGKLVFDRVIKTTDLADELTETALDLSSALDKANLGQAIVVAETTRPQRDRWDKDWVRAWVQSTRIGLHAMAEADGLTAWATDLATGAPLADVELFHSDLTRGKTGADGLGRIDRARQGWLWARKGADTAMLAGSYQNGNLGFPHDPGTRKQFFVVDDRKTYKPGEEVHVLGWVREVGLGKRGDVAPLQGAQGKVSWALLDSRGAESVKGEAGASPNGGFDFVVTLPKTANLGRARVRIDHERAGRHDHYLSIQEFRRPEFEVKTSVSEGPHFVGSHAIVTTDAKYYAGGGLANADVAWSVDRADGSFHPPNHAGWTFGKHDWGSSPRWSWHGDPREKKNRTSETWKGTTSGQGEHRIRLDFDALDPPYPMSLSIHGSVTDVNRQEWSSNASVLVHPANVYVGLKAEKYFVRAGEPIQLETLVADLDGKITSGRKVKVTSARIDFEQKGDQYEEKELDKATCDLVSGDAPARCTLSTRDGGRHRITGIVEDDSGRRSQTTMTLWVLGGTAKPDRDLKAGEVKLVTGRTEYKAGDTAEILVLSPFAPAEGLLTLRRGGILQTVRFSMATPMETVRVPLDEALYPGATAHVVVVGAAPRDDESGQPDPRLGKRPAFAQGSVSLSIPPVTRKLSLSVTPRDAKVDPGGVTSVAIDVKDHKGNPVPGSDVAVIVVDEAILALAAYHHPDPMGVFYPSRGANVQDHALRDRVLLAHPQEARQRELAERGSRYKADGEPRAANTGGPYGGSMMRMNMPSADAPAPPPPPGSPVEMPKKAMALNGRSGGEEAVVGSGPALAVRTDFNALAVFSPRLATDAKGHVDVPVKLPDSLTRYRVWAVAGEERRFGSQESTITARLPLMVRPSAPRFLNFGDRFELPVVLQNQTDKPLDVGFAARALNATIEGGGRKVTVPPNDRVEVRLAAAAVKPGTARIQVGAASAKHSDAAQVELPVWTPATTEAFATYGVIDQGAIAQRVKMPDGVVTQFGGLEVTTSSTALQALTDAVLYLVRYPYDCNEQIASRVMAIAALKDVLAAFKAEGLPAPEVLVANVAKDLARLKTRQHGNGGWGFWFTEPWPFLSIHVTHTLVRAKEKGFAIDAGMLQRAHSHLKAIESHIPHHYSPEARRALIAYALYVRHRLGDPDAAKAKKILQEGGGVDKTGLETVGWVYPTLSQDKGSEAETAQIRRLLANRATETAGAAHFTTGYGDGDHLLLHSDRRADGILLEGMIGDQPRSDLIPKLVAGLLAHKKAGRWASTQENAFVLLGLDRYFANYEGVTPDLVARVWLGDRYAGEHAFKGRTTERSHTDVPMQLLAEVKDANLILSKEGPGRLYFRVGMQYAPTDLRPPPMDRGFVVTRRYEAVDKPDEVKLASDGVWHVKAGAKVRVRVTMVNPARRYHVALVDPIPAGIEPLNAALAVTGPIPHDPSAKESTSWWSRSWYEHQNMRDERVEAFASLLWEGVHEYVYVARATTPGTFVVPPPKAEEMYSPEVFGRGGGDRVIVE